MAKILDSATRHALEIIGLLLILSFLIVSLLDAFGYLNDKEKYIGDVREPVSVDTPIRVHIPEVGVDASISNPLSTNIAVLDEELKNGAVRYPGSGTPGIGNMFLFGHSTSFSRVINQAYKTFNNIQNLEKGDSIYIYSSEKKYTYKVTNVRLASAEEVLVSFDVDENMLTLSTCNTFGARQERFVILADYVGSVDI
ncbi:MAG: class E sortase [Candidatus Pacebacteria bacterium]|nr:class E sortase [Candidatus Paceibacterota bacterium]